VADIARPDEIRGYVERAESLWGRIDILVNNAYGGRGEGVQGSALEVTEEGWDRGLALMAKALFLSTKHVVPIMRAAAAARSSTSPPCTACWSRRASSSTRPARRP